MPETERIPLGATSFHQVFDKLTGCLLGTAIGDSIGLPYEGLSRARVLERLSERPLQHSFLFGRGMVSDDTEHAILAGQAWLACGQDPDKFEKELALRLRGWLLGAPAGVGLATLKSTLKLWAGVPPRKSGVRSAGNGPAMRAPILGCVTDDPEIITRSSRITHTDSRAIEGAHLVALAARTAKQNLPTELFWREAEKLDKGDDWKAALEKLNAAAGTLSVEEYADSIGCTRGVTGYILHTGPVVLHAWLTYRLPSPYKNVQASVAHSDPVPFNETGRSSGPPILIPNSQWAFVMEPAQSSFKAAIESVVRLGGDTDTTAAILGGIMGAEIGPYHLPPDWYEGLWEWPRGVAWIWRLGEKLEESAAMRTRGLGHKPVPVFWPGIPARNALFLTVVLGHGFRRLLP